MPHRDATLLIADDYFTPPVREVQWNSRSMVCIQVITELAQVIQLHGIYAGEPMQGSLTCCTFFIF
jgi:hypothetical protein